MSSTIKKMIPAVVLCAGAMVIFSALGYIDADVILRVYLPLFAAIFVTLLMKQYFAAYGVVTSSNAGSCAFHRAMGYRVMAEFPACGWKFGGWHGVTWFEKRLRDGEPEVPPVSWRQL